MSSLGIYYLPLRQGGTRSRWCLWESGLLATRWGSGASDVFCDYLLVYLCFHLVLRLFRSLLVFSYSSGHLRAVRVYIHYSRPGGRAIYFYFFYSDRSEIIFVVGVLAGTYRYASIHIYFSPRGCDITLLFSYGSMWFYTVRYDLIWFYVIWYGSMWFDMVLCDSM